MCSNETGKPYQPVKNGSVVAVPSASGTVVQPVTARLLETQRYVYLRGEITYEAVLDVICQLQYLLEENDKVTLCICSYGGDVQAGLLLYDVIQQMDNLDLVCTGIAASIAAVVFAGGKRGHRIILPHSKVMIHEPYLEKGIGGRLGDLAELETRLSESKRCITEILSNHTGKTEKEIESAIQKDFYMTAREAVDFGIADSVSLHLF